MGRVWPILALRRPLSLSHALSLGGVRKWRQKCGIHSLDFGRGRESDGESMGWPEFFYDSQISRDSIRHFTDTAIQNLVTAKD